MPVAAGVAGALWQAHDLLVAGVLAAFLGLGLRAAWLAASTRPPRPLPVAVGVLAAVLWLGAGVLYGLFTLPALAPSAGTILAALLVALAVLGTTLIRGRRVAGRLGPRTGLAQLVLLLALLLLATLTLMRAGFLALTSDRPVLLVERTGETRPQRVRWAAPDQPPREETLTAYRVVLRDPAGRIVADTWLYGDEVAVRGRVLRLSPLLNAAGLPNLFALEFVHNGYRTAERHASFPHQAVPLPPAGPLAVHRWWRPIQARLLARWERGVEPGSTWAIRSTTIESTSFPLTDASGAPLRGTARLVLTPGGLTGG